jgi:hypothetical protein
MVDRGPAAKAENGAAARLRQRYPTIDDPRRRARVPRFAANHPTLPVTQRPKDIVSAHGLLYMYSIGSRQHACPSFAP